MNFIKENKAKSVVIAFLAIFIIWFLFAEHQSKLPYKVTGSEILEVKEKCRAFALQKKYFFQESNIGSHELVAHGYSEFGGFCYAEFIQNFGEDDSKLLYNTTQAKEVFRREWPKSARWYEYDFDRIVLGKNRIIDLRSPW